MLVTYNALLEEFESGEGRQDGGTQKIISQGGKY